MGTIELIVDSYMVKFGTKHQKDNHNSLKGNYGTFFSSGKSELAESSEFGEHEISLIVIHSLAYVLTEISKLVIKDGYSITKQRILSYLKRYAESIKERSENTNTTEEVVSNLKELLENEDKNKK